MKDSRKPLLQRRLHTSENGELDKTHEIRWPADKLSGPRSQHLTKHHHSLGKSRKIPTCFVHICCLNLRLTFLSASGGSGFSNAYFCIASISNEQHADEAMPFRGKRMQMTFVDWSSACHCSPSFWLKATRIHNLHRETALALKVRNTPSGNTIRFHTAVDR